MSIVLLGTAVGGTLTALRTTIISSERDETQAQAQVALLAAEDALHRAAYKACGSSPAMNDIVGDYSTAVGLASLPAGWTAAVTYVRMWGRDPVSAVEMWRDTCALGANSPQLVSVIVRSPSGEIGKTIQVVKRA